MHAVREREREGERERGREGRERGRERGERESNMSSAPDCLSAYMGLRTTAFIWHIRNYYRLIIGDEGKHGISMSCLSRLCSTV
jgi:hypothetical protein